MRDRSIVYAIGCGIILYIPFLVAGYLPYMSLPLKAYMILLVVSILVGGAISAAVILYRNQSLIRAVLRTITMFAGLLSTIVINGYIGTIRWLNTMLRIRDSDAMGRASGLVMVLFLGGLLLISVITNAAVAIRSIIALRDGTD